MSDRINIYLAGTIYDDEPGSIWKKEFINHLEIDGYKIFDPDPVNECNLTMVARDKAAINKCDVFVAYIEKYTAGTSMEIYHAFLKNDTPVIIISPNHIVDDDIWIDAHCHSIVPSVNSAAKLIMNMKF